MHSSFDLHNGDCLEVLRTMADNSVDAVVTDPPYGLAFMGKKWDYDVPSEDIWRECLRVLKPGGHLLAFAGTRTQHRMAVRIEDAGFEIRDIIAWVYGSGFPKSLDVSKAIDKSHGENRDRQLQFTAWMRSTGITAEQINEATGSCMASHYLTDKSQPAIATADMFDKLRPYLPEVPEYIERLVCERTGLEWTAYKQREVVGTKIAGIANKDEGSRHTIGAGKAVEVPVTAPATDAAKQWQGWGTALKPALEPITVARKPLVGTVAENVLRHGTGAINVDGCRVSVDPADPVNSAIYHAKPSVAYGKFASKENGEARSMAPPPAGRWPANLIHDGSEEVVGLFPETKSGAFKSTIQKPTNGASKGREYARMREDRESDSGSAARFFYCAKASKRDRDEGCEGLEERVASVGNVEESSGRDSTKPGNQYGDGSRRRVEAGLSPTIPRHNHHPTVKPTDLMRYLCRLVTPPGGVVLDPFTGSGSTGKAAILEGFRFVGIEREAEYIDIARARIQHAVEQISTQPALDL